MKRFVWILVVFVAALAAQAANAAQSGCGNGARLGSGDGLNTILALTDDQRLLRFQECRTRPRQIGSIAGLQAVDTALVGMDFRVQDGLLYGVGNGGGLYTIDTDTAVATPVGQLTVALSGNFFGVDFNPAANALRIISNTGQNLRHPFAGTLVGQTQSDSSLNYVGVPANGITGAAYTNNDLEPNTATTLFTIDTSLNQVNVQSPANAGSLAPTGMLTADADTPVGFDIYTEVRSDQNTNDRALNNRGFASLVVDGVIGFYRINLLTGEAFFIDDFSDTVIDIAIPLNQKLRK